MSEWQLCNFYICSEITMKVLNRNFINVASLFGHRKLKWSHQINSVLSGVMSAAEVLVWVCLARFRHSSWWRMTTLRTFFTTSPPCMLHDYLLRETEECLLVYLMIEKKASKHKLLKNLKTEGGPFDSVFSRRC